MTLERSAKVCAVLGLRLHASSSDRCLVGTVTTATGRPGDYIDRHNESPKPFIWTAKANDILEKVTRAQAPLNKCLSV
jgi:hypothetical protein